MKPIFIGSITEMTLMAYLSMVNAFNISFYCQGNVYTQPIETLTFCSAYWAVDAILLVSTVFPFLLM